MISKFSVADYYDKDMNLIETPDFATTFLNIPSVPFTNNWIGGNDGITPIHAGVNVQQRPISATIEMLANDYLDYQLLRDRMYEIFGFDTPFYVVDRRQPGKRFSVVLDSNFEPIRHNRINGTATIPLITTSPYAESIGTTQDIQANGIDAEEGLWGYGMGLIADDLQYTHTGRTFEIFNAGNVPIHPFEQNLKITISELDTEDDNFAMVNLTNETGFQTTESVSEDQTIILDGPNVTSNGLQYLRNTNKEFIELDPGWNVFLLSHAAKVEFDFRFCYL